MTAAVDSTFSLSACDPEGGAFGVAVSTASLAVGKRVPHVRDGVGLVAIQGRTNVRYGITGLRLLEIGFSPRQALDALLAQDAQHRYRQVLIATPAGDFAVHTGELTEPWHGHLVGDHFVAMGNTLPGRQVLEAMVDGFQGIAGPLAVRLVAGLQRGYDAGGDREGARSAAVVVTSPRQFAPWGRLVDLRVDDDPRPVDRLRELLTRYLAWEQEKLATLDTSIYGFGDDDGGPATEAARASTVIRVRERMT